MRIIGLKHDVVGPDQIHQLLERHLFVDVTTVDLTGEVLAGLELELGIVRAHISILEHVVTGFEHEGNEAYPRFHREEFEIGEAGKNPRKEQIPQLLAVVHEEPKGRIPVGAPNSRHSDALGRIGVIEGPGPDMKTHRKITRTRGRPDRIPMAAAQDGKVMGLRLPRKEDTLVPHLGAAFDLDHRGLDIPERGREDRNEPPRVWRNPIDQEVVVGPHAGQHELRIIEAQKSLAPKATHVGVEGHGPDPDTIHVLEPSGGVVTGLRHFIHVSGRTGKRLRPAGHGGEAHRHEAIRVADGPTLGLGGLVSHDARGHVLVTRRQTTRPEVSGLRHMGIDINHPILDLGFVGGHGDSSLLVRGRASRGLLTGV